MPSWAPWLLAGAAVLAAAAAWGLRRRRSRRPSSGDIWWADVPFTDGTGSKFRPCLVMTARRTGIVVLKITSQDKSHRRDHIVIPTRAWDPHAEHDSYLNLGEPITVQPSAFRRRAGACDRAVLREARRRAATTPRARRPRTPNGRTRNGPRTPDTPGRTGRAGAP